MPPTTNFSVTPLNPHVVSKDPVTGRFNYLADLWCFGVHFAGSPKWRLRDQYNENKASFRMSFIDSPPPSTLPHDYWNHSVARLYLITNATTQNEYLLKYHVESIYGQPRAAFYINGNFIGSSDPVDGDDILEIRVDCPPPQHGWVFYMFPEGRGWGAFDLKKIECEII